MTTQHTPSPWTVSGKQVKSIDHGKRYTVATANNPKFTDEANANNARLIAAAPDLLAALQALVGEADLGELDYDDDTRALLDNARAAIERATGVPA